MCVHQGTATLAPASLTSVAAPILPETKLVPAPNSDRAARSAGTAAPLQHIAVLATVILALVARQVMLSAPTDSAGQVRRAITPVPALNLEIAAAQAVIVGALRTIAQRPIVKPPILILVRLHRNSMTG